VTDKIDLRLAPATQTLSELIQNGGSGQYDFAFIDADKTGYDDYFELTLELLRPGGLIALDNCLWGGNVIDENDQDPDTKAIRELNDKISQDRRVQAYLAPIGDGIYLATKL
jgi:predicted O-methyltransferase YrrM